MNLRKAIKNKIINKQGSSFVEAGITLPLFIIAVVALALIINIAAICENICYVTSIEIREIDIEAYVEKVPVLLEKRLERIVCEENSQLKEYSVTDLDYLYSSNNIDDLIAVDTRAFFLVENPVGVYGDITFNLGILSRGFTGKCEHGSPLDDSGFINGASEICFIFPKYGIRYHDPDCWYVTTRYKDEDNKIVMQKEEAKRKGYTPCKVCNGGDSISSFENDYDK